MSADLDALDRGVIEAGQLAAEAMSRICALEAQVAELARHMEQLFTAEAIIRRAEFGLPQPPPRAAEASEGDPVSRDRYRPLTAAAVLLVATIAAVVSHIHVATLALAYGQAPLAVYLLPLSIDGVVATSSLVLLRSARAGVSAPWLARTGLVLAVLATLAANVASGPAPHSSGVLRRSPPELGSPEWLPEPITKATALGVSAPGAV